MRGTHTRHQTVFAILGIIPVAWVALVAAPFLEYGGLPELLRAIGDGDLNFQLSTLHYQFSPPVFIFLAAYGLGLGMYFSTRRNKRPGEEHGSAKWGNPKKVNRKYADKKPMSNKLLTRNVRIGFDVHRHRRNLNVLVVGGSGAGKTRFYCKPNLMQCGDGDSADGQSVSFFCLDPKGENLRDTGKMLEAEGYTVKALDLINMCKSHGYNPFVYLRDDNDVQRLVTNLFKATTPKGATSQDPFWDTAAQMLLMALVFYLKYEAPNNEQNFPMVMEMLRAASTPDGDDDDEDEGSDYSPLDELFERLEMRSPDHIALKYYGNYRSGSGKTLKSIQITLAARLEKFNLDSLAELTTTDELELDLMGERKTALFAIVPDNDASFNFLVSILYTQLFQQLFYSADHKHGGTLPVHVHFIMDEFANLSLPDDFEKILSVMRSRGVSVSIILQNMAQLKALFEKQWESIVGNCDSFLYLGGNEQSTHEYVTKLLDKETLDTNTYGKSSGRSGNYSTNYQQSGRELLTAGEVRMLDNDYALLFIRGERPILDKKLDILRHPNVALTPDGGGQAFKHGEAVGSLGNISIARDVDPTTLPKIEVPDIEIMLYSPEDLKRMFAEREASEQ